MKRQLSTGLLGLLLVLSVYMNAVEAVHVFDVYKMFQVEQPSAVAGGNPTLLGSHKVAVNLLATSSSQSGSLSRSFVLMPFSEVTVQKLDELIVERGAEGVLILLPRYRASLEDKDIENWRHTELALLKKQYSVPIYFAWEDTILRELYKDIQRVSDSGAQSLFDEVFGGAANQYQFVVTGNEAVPMKDTVITNLQGTLRGVSEGKAIPTIAVVAHYDSFSVAPGLSNGADSSASGVVALLELAKLFKKLYDNPKTQPSYNMAFVLTGGSSVNFAGTKHWLATTDARYLETIEFALCLDGIGRGSDLYLHVSKINKEENVQKIYESFNRTAAALDFKVHLNHKKINVSSSDIEWEHEQFSMKKVPAATLADHAEALPPMGRSHIYDVKERVSVKTLQRNIKFVAESLAKHLYGYDTKDIDIFESSLSLRAEFVESWFDALASEVISGPYLPKKSPIVASLSKVLQEQIGDVSNQTFALSNEFVFYDSPMHTTVSVYRSKPAFFDVILFVVIAAYLAGFYAALVGPAEAIKQAKALFATKKKVSSVNTSSKKKQ